MSTAVLPGIQFGAGIIFATPSAGNLPTNPTPQQVGVIQDLSIDISGDIKSLFGQYQWPVDSAIGKREIKGSFNFAQITNFGLNQLFFADTIAPGVISTAYQEGHAIPGTPFMVTTAHAANWVADMGVIDLTTGLEMTLLPTGTPATGQYTVTAGVYLFAAADTGKAVVISYTWTNATVGTTLTTANHVMGFGPVVNMTVPLLYQGGNFAFNFPNARLGKISLKTKLDDYMMISVDFAAFAGAGGNPVNIYNLG